MDAQTAGGLASLIGALTSGWVLALVRGQPTLRHVVPLSGTLSVALAFQAVNWLADLQSAALAIVSMAVIAAGVVASFIARRSLAKRSR